MSSSPPRPLSNTPSLAPSSPKRRPLHQRSESQANSNAPTIRFVADSGSSVYSKSPFPSHPSQILQHRYAPNFDQGSRVSPSDENANNASAKPTKHEALVPSPLQLRKSKRASTSTTTSEADTSFDTYGSALSPSSSRFSSRTSPPNSVLEEDHDRTVARLNPVFEEIASRKPSPLASRSTIRPVIPSASNVRVQEVVKQLETSLASKSFSDTLPARRQDRPTSSASSANYVVLSKSSADTLPVQQQERPESSTSSNNYQILSPSSPDTLPARRQEHPESSPSSGNFVVYSKSSSDSLPNSQSSPKPLQKLKHKPKGLTNTPKTPKSVPKQESHESLAYSDASYTTNVERPRSASSPASPSHVSSVRAAVQTGAKVQYPAVRAPSASGSWAEVSRPPSKNLPRMNDGPSKPQQWSSRLSTIASESTRTTQSNSSSGFGYQPRRRTIGSVVSDGEGLASQSEHMSSEFEYGSGVLTGTESNVSIPQPLFTAHRPLPELPGAAGQVGGGRDSDERDDTLGELHAHPPLRQQRSGFLSRFSSQSRPSSAESSMSGRSQLSFLGDLSWARRYYSGEQTNFGRSQVDVSTESGGSIRLETATSGNSASPTSDTFPTTVWRPRTRPHERTRNDRSQRPRRARDSAIAEVSEIESALGNRRSRAASLSVNEMMYSPHLRRDRRITNRYSAWTAPSFEEPFVSSIFGPTGRQLLLFCLGFICPPLWMLAAFLPLPKRPPAFANPDALPGAAQMSEDGSQAYPNSDVPSDISLDEKRWQKARWWRTVNRLMSILGLLIIGAVVALAVLGTRMRRGQGQVQTNILQPLQPLPTGT